MGAAPAQFAPSRTVVAGRSHWLVQFESQPTIDDVSELRRRGAREVAHVPDFALIVSVDGQADFAGMNLARVEPWASPDKLSPELFPADGTAEAAALSAEAEVVVQFHADTGFADARAVLAAAGAQVIGHPQLADRDYLVRVSREAIAKLAEWDEVAYVFPASEELSNGSPVQACVGAMLDHGTVGQLAATVGQGWAPGRGAARLLYGFGALSAKLDGARIRTETERAMAEWSRVAAIDFALTSNLAGPATIAVRFGRGTTGVPLPFDGPGRTLAYTYYPAPPNSEPSAGDMYFDDDESWKFDGDVDYFSVALHELGHALGLAHADRPGAVMYPYYRRATALGQLDIETVRTLYATRNAQPTAPAPSPTPSTPAPATPSPSAPPATPPAPSPTPVPPAPAPSTPQPTDRTAPTLAILSPVGSSVSTTAEVLRVSGTATDAGGLSRVEWVLSSGARGAATGTSAWSAEVPLPRGIALVTIRAFDLAGNSAWRSIAVTRR